MLLVVGSATAATSKCWSLTSYIECLCLGSASNASQHRATAQHRARCHDPNREYKLASNSHALFWNVGYLQRYGKLSHENDAVAQHGQRFT
jgi:hypothetical protein